MGKIKIKCTNCNKEIYKYQSQIKNSNKLFCSQRCQHIYRTGKKTGKATGENKACPYCQKEFYAYPSEVDTKIYCSRECMYKHKSEIGAYSGANCNFYKGGHDEYRGPNWKNQMRLARERDKNICQECGKTKIDNGNKNMSVHHIVPFRFFNDNYIEANKLSNLICLCSSCHQKQESHTWDTLPDEYKHIAELQKVERRCFKRYSQDELRFMRDNYKMPFDEMAKHLGRTTSSVESKFYEIGLKRKTIPSQDITEK